MPEVGSKLLHPVAAAGTGVEAPLHRCRCTGSTRAAAGVLGTLALVLAASYTGSDAARSPQLLIVLVSPTSPALPHAVTVLTVVDGPSKVQAAPRPPASASASLTCPASASLTCLASTSAAASATARAWVPSASTSASAAAASSSAVRSAPTTVAADPSATAAADAVAATAVAAAAADCSTIGGGWVLTARPDAPAAPRWRNAAPCAWVADVGTQCLPHVPCDDRCPAPPGAEALAPLRGMVVTFAGDSTHQELHAHAVACLTGAARQRPHDVSLPGGGAVRVNMLRTSFVRDLLRKRLPARSACYGIPHPTEVERREAGAAVTLADAVADPALFASAVGDVLVMGGGLWNLGRDWHTYPREGHFNGGMPRYNTTAALVAAYGREVAELAAAFDGNAEPWRSVLLSRTVWRSIFATESGPEFPGQANDVVAAANAAAAAVWGALGVPVVDVFKYTAAPSGGGESGGGGGGGGVSDGGGSDGNATSRSRRAAERIFTFTRDSVHPHAHIYGLALRDIFSVVVQTAVRHGLAPFPDDGGGGKPVEGGPRLCGPAPLTNHSAEA